MCPTPRTMPGPGFTRRNRARPSTATVHFTLCSKTACRRCAKWRACSCARANPAELSYTAGLFRCESGGIGRRAGLRIQWGNPCEFESRLSHQRTPPIPLLPVMRSDMQVSVESIGKLERRMQVQVPAERVANEIASRLKTLSRTARLKGFRPGKAPLNVIRRQFGVQVHREVIGELLQSSFAEAVSANRLAPAGNPRIEPQSVDEGQDLRYVATFEVFPEVALQPVENLEVVRVTAEVAPGDVDAMLERLRKQQVKFNPVSRAADNGDRVVIDFDGAIDGVPFAGGKGEKIAIVLGEGRMLPDFERGLIGAVAGEDREVEVLFPADYRAAELAGKNATFKIRVRSVEESRLPDLDEEFCKAFGVNEGGIEKLREEVADNMRRELEQALRNQNKSVVMDKLLQANPIDVPNTLIEAQVRDLQADAM